MLALKEEANVELSSNKPLETRLLADEEKSLLSDYQNKGCNLAAKRVLDAHTLYVRGFARRFYAPSIDSKDLVQQGMIGLFRAMEKYDLSSPVRFVTFAKHYIRAEMADFYIKNKYSVRRASSKAQRKLFFNSSLLKTDEGETLDQEKAEKVANDLDVKVSDVMEMSYRLSAPDVQYVVTRPDAEDFTQYDEDLNSNFAHNFEEESEQSHQEKLLEQAISTLTDREQRVISMRWLSEDKLHLRELGAEFGVSSEAIRQVEQRALKKLRIQLTQEK